MRGIFAALIGRKRERDDAGGCSFQQAAAGEGQLAPAAAVGALDAGCWPNDPDEVPAWRLAQEARAAALGIVIPAYRTQAAFDRAVALCEARLAPPPKLTLAGPEAAARFVAALRDAGPAARYTSEELTAAYLEHCAAHNLEPAAENVLREALRQIPGVTRGLVNIANGPNGRRHRPTVWVIAPETSETADGFRAAA